MRTVIGTAAALMLMAAPCLAGEVTVTQAWARPTSAANRTGIAFVTVTNGANAADTIVSASTPVAEKVEFHAHVHKDGLMKMEPQAKVDVAAGQALQFSPAGLHLMLVGLKAPLSAGQTFPVILTFSKACAVAATVTVGGGPGPDASVHDEHMKDPAYRAQHEQHMKDPDHRAMHEMMHGPGK